MSQKFFLLVVALIVFFSTQGFAQPGEAESEVRQALERWHQAFNAKDAKTLATLYDPEVLYASNFAPLKRGIEDVVGSFASGFPTQTGFLLFREEALIVESNMALVVGKFYFQPTLKEDEEGPTGRVTLVYRRHADGRWLLLYDMDNQPPDVSPGDFEGVSPPDRGRR